MLIMTVSNPTVSVIIPTFNRANLLMLAIQSVLDQTFSDFELIVVDDASTDNTQQKVMSINDPRIQYILHQQNSGECGTRNTGLTAAKGQFIAFLDSDDEWLPNKLEKQLALFQTLPADVGVVYSWLKVINDQGHVIHMREPDIRGDVNDYLIYKNLIGTPSTVMIRKESIQPNLTFDTNLRCCGDWDMWLQISRNFRFDVIPEPLALYRDHNEDNRGSTNHEMVTEGHLVFLSKNHQNIEDFYQKSDSLENKTKSKYLFQIGRRLMCHGYQISKVDAISTGRKYLFLAASVNILNIYLWLHYLVACCGGLFYSNSIQAENRFRSTLSSIVKKASFPVTHRRQNIYPL